MTGALGLTASEVAVPPPASATSKEKNDGTGHASFDPNGEVGSMTGREERRKEGLEQRESDCCMELTVALRIELLKVFNILKIARVINSFYSSKFFSFQPF